MSRIWSGCTRERERQNKRVELGHTILVASDQWGFLVEHQVAERQAEESSKTFQKLRHRCSAVESDIKSLGASRLG
ncbi:MAG: hypothetical protein IT420_08735 [Candidatus Brocadia sp.]|nr:hypothetical protein [Candidatus Brocadia sp.]MDG5995397.1 hypothetical protein [Candidatus Brocadia sp.]